MARAFIAMGSNIAPEENIRAAFDALISRVDVKAVSMVYATEPVGKAGQAEFYNCVLEAATELTPFAFKFKVLRQIEAELGRKRTSDRYAPRTIDLDLIIYDDLIIDLKGLALPDPEIQQRPFLAIPLSELAPDLEYPGTGLSVASIAAGLSSGGMRPLVEYTAGLREALLRTRSAEREAAIGI